MRRFSKQYVLVDGKKYHLVSVKDDYSSTYEPIGLIQKSKEKDEEGFMAEGEMLQCPNRDELGSVSMAWIGVPIVTAAGATVGCGWSEGWTDNVMGRPF